MNDDFTWMAQLARFRQRRDAGLLYEVKRTTHIDAIERTFVRLAREEGATATESN